VVEAHQAMRGASFLVAVTVAAELGDLRRFDPSANYWKNAANIKYIAEQTKIRPTFRPSRSKRLYFKGVGRARRKASANAAVEPPGYAGSAAGRPEPGHPAAHNFSAGRRGWLLSGLK
jgi:hypothetical protein